MRRWTSRCGTGSPLVRRLGRGGGRELSLFIPRHGDHPGIGADASQFKIHSGLPVDRFRKDRVVYRYPAGSARAALWISHSVSISSGLGMAASLSGFQLPEVLSQSAVSMVLMLSPPLIGGILGALLVHQVSGRYVREITILPGGKQMKLTRTTIFGALKTQTIPIKRVEMTIYQYNRGSIQHWYPIQWARDPYDHSRLNDDDDDDMYIDRSCASSFVDKEGLQYVFGRYLEERNPPWEHLLTRKLDPEAAMSLMLDDNDPSPQREPQQQPQTVSAEEQGGGGGSQHSLNMNSSSTRTRTGTDAASSDSCCNRERVSTGDSGSRDGSGKRMEEANGYTDPLPVFDVWAEISLEERGEEMNERPSKTGKM